MLMKFLPSYDLFVSVSVFNQDVFYFYNVLVNEPPALQELSVIR